MIWNRCSTAHVALALLVYAQGGLSAQTQPPAEGTARGIYVGGTRLGVSAEIEIERDGRRGMVPSTFEFRTGDRFWVHLSVNRASYVYVLNRTLTGSKAASRGIKLIAEEDRKAPPADAYTLVFPAPNTAPQLVPKDTPTIVPGKGQYFTMDDVPGAEMMLIVASETPLTLANYFDRTTGRLLQSGTRNDSVGTVLNRLNSELTRMTDNAQTEQPATSRDIKIVDAPRPTPAPPGPPQAVPPSGPPPASSAVPPKAGPAAPPTQSAKGSPAGPTANPDRKAWAAAKEPGKPLTLEMNLVHLPR